MKDIPEVKEEVGPSAKWLFATAFLSGLVVMVIEIGGARALAPFFGTSLKVWTAQITATMLFLALGYGLGGHLSRRPGSFLPALFVTAGLWLALYPHWRAPLLGLVARVFGVALGSFLSGAALFGPPLVALGAVTPLLVGRLDRARLAAGASAGDLFLVSTLGSLAGGWITALLLIPFLPLRWSLAGAGVLLIMLGAGWHFALKGFKPVWTVLVLLGLAVMASGPRPVRGLPNARQLASIVYCRQSQVGLIQVLDLKESGRMSLMLDGVTQGGMAKESGRSCLQFTESLNVLGYRLQPKATRALLLGLGCGALARELNQRGLEVDVAEVEPEIETVARRFFGLPPAVKVELEDGRAFLRRDSNAYDLIFLDTFAGENMPFQLCTLEAFKEMRDRLRPGGRLLINTVTSTGGRSAGLARLEATLSRAFDQAWVYVEEKEAGYPVPLVNATLAAGDDLKDTGEVFPTPLEPGMLEGAVKLVQTQRPARRDGMVATDDHSDLDYADADLRAQWRALVQQDMGAEVLGD